MMQNSAKDPRSSKTQKSKKDAGSSGKIRRIHELVALYRCKFKPNISDASIIGTLHSAASVIQIHFRYRKHLMEAQRVMPMPSANSSLEKVPSNKKSSSKMNDSRLSASHE